MRLILLGLLAALATGCSTIATDRDDWIEPAEAIRIAHGDPTYGKRGQFVMTVNGLASEADFSYLNSEQDYRDPETLTIRIPTRIVPALEKRLGLRFDDLKNRSIVVLGVAERRRVDFTEQGKPTGSHYFQTHVDVDSPTQIKFAQAPKPEGD